MPSIDGLAGVLAFLKSLQPKIQAQIARKIFSLAEDPFPHDAESLKGYVGIYRVDCGEFRIVYRHQKASDLVEIILLGKRNDDEVYKQLKRMLG